MSLWAKHKILETNAIYLAAASLVVIAIGGLVEIVPLFYLKNTIETVEGIRPYTPLELAGRNIYVREGCYNCHSQMIRPLRDEVERYGHYSLAAESMYDRPFQWGSKRTGPDLARVGGKYSDLWQLDHLNNPRSVVPTSIMPSYSWLERTPLDVAHIQDDLRVQQLLGVPYTDEMIDVAMSDIATQGSAEPDDTEGFLSRYPNAKIGDFTAGGGLAGRLSEADALIAYLQALGTFVDFSLYDDQANIR
jgi:cytochrome c oxidase cbb3-type subunit 2